MPAFKPLTVPEVVVFEMTREAWLGRVVEFLRPMYAEMGYPLTSTIRLSVGFPGGRKRAKAIGQCWPKVSAADNVTRWGRRGRFSTPPINASSLIGIKTD
jgi:hypothetical protein